MKSVDSTPAISTKENSSQGHFYRYSLLIDGTIINLAFFFVNFLKNDSFDLSTRYTQLLFLFNAAWLFVSLLSSKFRPERYRNYANGIFLLIRSTVFTFYVIAVIVVMTGMTGFSRLQIFGSGAIALFLETIIYTVYAWQNQNISFSTANNERLHYSERIRFRIAAFISDYTLFVLAFYISNYIKRDTFTLASDYDKALLILSSVWLITSLFTRKFSQTAAQHLSFALVPYIKSFLLIFSTTAVIIFAFQFFSFSRGQIFGSLLIFFALEIALVTIYHFLSRHLNKGDVENIEIVKQKLQQEELEEREASSEFKAMAIGRSTRTKLQRQHLKNHPLLFVFLANNIDLNNIDDGHTRVFDTKTLFNIETLSDHSCRLLINLQPINNIRRINQYFLEIHRKIFNGGYFVGSVKTIEMEKNAYFSRYPLIIARLMYPFHFLFKRVFPKIPVLQQIYFFLTRGKNRSVSKAEALGRLYFAGYRIIAIEELQERLFFIAQRAKAPSTEKNPSFGPIINLRRIGYQGKMIRVRKFRTMHPYSEFLQEFIYENNKLQENGKFENDFRITDWGKVLRRFWLDELPQLTNFWQGDLSLVGVRALSQHYFSLYPEDLQKMRIQFKPGLVPPYYADMPESFEEIVASERRYLSAKEKSPLKTDLRYFFLAFYNIIFKSARSR
jgi:lipopolysaccharide/colanic/teichoic acid biosynthesis glycosyltransferase